MMKSKANRHLDKVLELAKHMVNIADEGVLDDSADNGFFILYGVILDNAHKIRALAEKEYRIRNMKIPD